MDRTLVAPYRAEERELNEKLHKKLKGLMLIHQPNEELKKCFTLNMFLLKSNQQAFFQVLHYLFIIHDAAEFKKRFYWPITDKRGESYFRSSTIEYLKHLSDKHNLNWNIKSYLVQTPGGMKFITFLMDIVDFIIDEQVRLIKKQINIEIPAQGFSEHDLKQLQKKYNDSKDYTTEYIKTIEHQTAKFRNQTQLIKNELNEIEETNGIILEKQFLQAFESSNEHHYEEEFLKKIQRTISFETPLMELKNNIEKYQQKATDMRRDKNVLRQALQKIMETTCSDATLSMNSMIEAFVQIQPTLENWLQNIIERNAFVNSEATLQLNNLKIEFEQTEAQIIECQKKFNTNINLKGKEASRLDLSNNCILLSKYVSTPPIKIIPSESISQRLPLQGEATSNSFLDLTHSARKAKLNPNASFDPNITLNRSKIIDPVNLLRTIYKNKTKNPKFLQTSINSNISSSSSSLGLKWKERQQAAFGVELEKSALNNDSFNLSFQCNPTNDMQISSPKTPFNMNSGDITRIALSFKKGEGLSPSPLLPSMVKKVQDDALNLQNLSTSPTGRLEPLHVDDFATQKCKNMNDIDVDGDGDGDGENNTNFLNIQKKLAFDISQHDEDSIFNTSDTVLKDID